MVKRAIQISKPGYSVGIEYDIARIRAARVSSDGRGGFAVSAVEEQTGHFAEDAELIEGLRQLKNKLGAGVRDTIVSCVSGKQVFATQMGFRRLAGEEMEQALRLELRKIVHFEVATSALDFETLGGEDETIGSECQVVVALAANSILTKQMSALDRAGLRPAALDVLPLSVANALWAWKDGGGMQTPTVALHVGPQVSTLVIDGEYSPFFNRSIPFAPEEGAEPMERAKRLQTLAEEVSRSLAFYEKSSGVGGFQELVFLGESVDQAGLVEAIQSRTGLRALRMDLVSKLGGAKPGQAGKFDLAVALAIRGDA